tara:strand:- start:1662 stop:2015 length:354 start_codon:yes stop_codon:yes gene_type:complete
MNIINLEKKLNNISIKKDELNDDLKNIIHYLADLDETNQTRQLKYDMYDGLDKLYEIENDKYHDLIWKYSDSYLEMSDFYVGKNLPKDDFKKNLSDIYMFMYYVLENMNYMNEYDVD